MVRRNSTRKGWKTLSAVSRALSHDAVQDRACNRQRCAFMRQTRCARCPRIGSRLRFAPNRHLFREHPSSYV
ncbi:hypothetical protein C2L66_08640 [Paraburkholderia caribensis]|nr:hypothetical protein C2L66_08640 [Paraburkholderia caribensis]